MSGVKDPRTKALPKRPWFAGKRLRVERRTVIEAGEHVLSLLAALISYCDPSTQPSDAVLRSYVELYSLLASKRDSDDGNRAELDAIRADLDSLSARVAMGESHR